MVLIVLYHNMYDDLHTHTRTRIITQHIIHMYEFFITAAVKYASLGFSSSATQSSIINSQIYAYHKKYIACMIVYF
jgi:hypothetical protein